jgi:hypothetical protein
MLEQFKLEKKYTGLAIKQKIFLLYFGLVAERMNAYYDTEEPTIYIVWYT